MSNVKSRRILVIADNQAAHDNFRTILDAVNDLRALDVQECASVAAGDAPAAPAAPTSPSSPSSMGRESYEIDSASEGQQGCEKLSESMKEGRPYALAFVDLCTPPGWDGVETLRKIWELDPDIHAVICTERSEGAAEEILRKLGRVDRVLVLEKPLGGKEVYQVACALLEQWSQGGGAQIQAHTQWPEVQAPVPNADTALHDGVTGLANRVMLLTEMNQRMLRAARLPGYAVAALFLNVDRFRLINESLGRAAGDRLLSEIATRLQAMVRKPGKVAQWPRDIVARTGGDEFVLLLDTIRASQDAAHVADRILNTLAKPITLDELEVVVSASIGIAMSSPACQQPEDILRDADTARYHAKREGNERSRIFDARMHDAAVKRLWMESDLRRAIEAGELMLHYQPIPSASTGKVAEVEALVRWQHPEHGLISPGDFIPLAEETGLIIPLGNWVLERACRQLREWDSSIPEFADVVVAVNVSGRQLMRPEFAAEVTAILQHVGVRPERVKLEITESAMIASGSAATVRLAELREAGLQLHMDDFGSGYSSLSYLYRLPFVHLKMDRSFVEAMEVDQNARPVVEAIVKLGHSLHLKVVAEGVENAAQLSFLRQVGCDFLQGFYISPPVPAEQAAAYVGETNRSIALHAMDRTSEMAIPTAIAA